MASAPIHAFLEFFLTSTQHNIFSKPLAAFPLTYHRNNGQRCKRGMNPGTMTNSNPQTEIWPNWIWTSNLLFFFPVINPSQQNPNFQQPCRILPTTWCEKEKILVTSIFSFHTIFSALSKTNFVILGNVYFVVCRCFKLFSKILLFDKELKYMIVS